jgi:hypothetical protein
MHKTKRKIKEKSPGELISKVAGTTTTKGHTQIAKQVHLEQRFQEGNNIHTPSSLDHTSKVFTPKKTCPFLTLQRV